MTRDHPATAPGLRLRGALLSRLIAARTEEQLRHPPAVLDRVMRALRRRSPRRLRRDEEWIPRADGGRLRVVVWRRPDTPGDGDAPGLLWLHGGGYALGTPEQEVGAIRSFVEGSGAVVVSPDYRLSSEAPYPAALDDAYATLVWLRDNAARLGVRPEQLAVGGASAGGGLTAALTLRARDRGEVAVAFQMPIYPMIDDRARTEHARTNAAPVWDAVTNRNAWRIYLGELSGSDDVPAYAAPARAADLRGLPPTMTYVGDLEGFRDETLRYVADLDAAGVPVEHRVYPGCYHGFDLVAPRAPVSRAARSFRDQWFGYAVRTHRAPQPG